MMFSYLKVKINRAVFLCLLLTGSAQLSGQVLNVNTTTVTSGAQTYSNCAGIVSPSDGSNVLMSGTASVVVYSATSIRLNPGFKASGFTGTGNFKVYINNSLSVNSPAICTGKTTTLTATGGSSYSWSTGATAASIVVSPTSTTSYTVTGTNSNSCTVSVVAKVTVNPLPTVTVNNATINTGQTATLTATGASTYSWSTGANTVSINVNPLTNTSYTVTGTSSFGCSASAVATVTVVNALNITGVVTDVNCSTNALGTINLTATGGTPPYSFLWSNGKTTQNLTNIQEGVYQLIATDNAGTMVKKEFRVYTCTNWTDIVNVFINGDTLIKTSIDGFANAGAKSKNLNYQQQAGAIKYVVQDLTKYFVVGLSKEEKKDMLFSNTKSAFAIKQDSLKIYVKGGLKAVYGGLAQGDAIELVQSPVNISFYKNNQLLYSADSANQDALKVDFIPYKQNSTVTTIKSSFGLPQFFLNTTLLNDNARGLDSINVVIYSGITHSSFSGRIDTVDLPAAFIDSTINLFFELSKQGLQTTALKCVTSKYGTVKSLSFYDDPTANYIALDSSLYQVKNNNELVLIPINRSTTELIPPPPFHLNLEGGLVLSPNGDNNFDYLTLSGKENVTVFEITIYNLSSTEVFHSTQKNFQWDGKNYSSTLVKGTYNYVMNINNQTIKGAFLIAF